MLSNVLTVRVLPDNVLQQYKPANKKHLFKVSLGILFVGLTPGHFPTSGFSSTEGFGSRFFVGYTSSEYFRMDGGYSVIMVPPTSNAPTCGVLAPEVKTAASTHQQPTAWYLVRSVQSAPPSMPLHLPSMLLCMFGVYPIHHPILTLSLIHI